MIPRFGWADPVVGSNKISLITQSLTESVLLTLFALLVAIFLVYLLLPEFNHLIRGELSIDSFKNPKVILFIIGGAILVGLFAGVYPAFYLSTFNPCSVLKGQKTKGVKSEKFRRNFSWDLKTDHLRTCIINEAALKEFGLENPVGKILHKEQIEGSSFSSKDIEIIGVVKDFHFSSLYNKISPLVFGWNEPCLWNTSIRISPKNIQETIKYMKKVWMEFSPEFPFEYSFQDETFDNQYKSEEKPGKIFGYFATFGILIASLGLFGLASFTADQRSKDIWYP